MRRLTRTHFFVAMATVVMLTGCSGSGSASLAPSPASPAGTRHLASFYSCPTTGSIKYVANFFKNAISVYVGKFSGQSPCGQIASPWLSGPEGLYVQAATHDLFVANQYGRNILVFHRGAVDPYDMYYDPTGQVPIEVTVAPDGTVLASNITNVWQNLGGSISTWIAGPNGGTFVGNFPETNSSQGAFIAVKKNGTVYFDDVDQSMLQGFVWTTSCPAGVCGDQTRVAGVVLHHPGGIAFDKTGDLLATDEYAATADTFELPNPVPSTFPMAAISFDMVLGTGDRSIFTANPLLNEAFEYSYPSGTLVGTVSGLPGGGVDGIAVDP